MRKTFNYLLAICSLAVVFMGCQKDDSIEHEVVQEPGLYFNLASLDNDMNVTRALNDPTTVANGDENKINKLWALYYAKGSGTTDADYTYIYHEAVDIPTGSNNLYTAQTFRLNKGKSTSIQSTGTALDRKVLFVTNITSIPAAVTASTATLKTAKETLTNTVVSNVSSWGGTETGKYIPMYACSEAVNIPSFPYDKMYYINGTNNETEKTYSLVRMMAKFTIISKKINLADAKYNNSDYNFEIKKVAIVNGNTRGLVCHGNYWSTLYGGRVTQTTIPGSPAPADSTNANRIAINDTWASITQQKIVVYGFEKKNPSTQVNNRTNCYILLEGTRYSKTGGTETDITYMLPIYLIKEETGALKGDITQAGDILRNHHYTYTIEGYKLYTLNAKLTIVDLTLLGIPDANPIPLR